MPPLYQNTAQRTAGGCKAGVVVVLMLFAAVADAAPPGWKLVWEDDFDTLNRDHWELVESHQPTNNSLHAYLPGQVAVHDGKLVIRSEAEPSGSLAYRSGQVVSKSAQRHGRWEVRAKLPSGKGMWPAIWLLPNLVEAPWPSGGEIDIMESRGDRPTVTSSAFHYGSHKPFLHRYVYAEQQSKVGDQLVRYDAGYHTYAVDWTPNTLRFYVDDVHFHTVRDQGVDGFLTRHAAPMHLRINNAIGGDFLEDPDDSTEWPQQMEVDWVRVYRGRPTPTRGLQNPSFEASGGSLAGWSTFGLRMSGDPNMTVTRERSADGEASLKMFGSFEEGNRFSGVSQGVAVEPGQTVDASLKCFVSSSDPLDGTRNVLLLKIEFYREAGAAFGGDQMLDVEQSYAAHAWTAKDRWVEHSVQVTAPAGAVEARAVVVFRQSGMGKGAVYVDDLRMNAS